MGYLNDNAYIPKLPEDTEISKWRGSQLCVTTFEKGITIIFMLCLVLTFGRVSESASSSGLGIG